jgi:hypothetical protein
LVSSGKGRKKMDVVVHVPDRSVEPVWDKLANSPTALEVVALDAILKYLELLANPHQPSSPR